jgi:glycosyltransferase involved in cell wall biosynthesis
MPTVSVIIPSFNHEQYVRECIQSVLDQTYQDFEIVITDDGSCDGTVDAIKSFTDPRIKLFVHNQNQGACVASNNCIRHSEGKYIAMLSSDDAWFPEKLETQVRYLEQHPEIGAVFGKVEWIDASGNTITEPSFPFTHVFDVENRDRFQWLRHFFYNGNCLCHPCSLIRRECYDEVGLLDPSMASIPDFDLWIRLCTKYEIFILDQKLIRFRRIGEDFNASGDNLKSRIRNKFEYKQVLSHYLILKDAHEVLRVFPEAAKYGPVTSDLSPYFLARVAIETGIDLMAIWGLELIYNLLKDKSFSKKLEQQCSFAHRDFIKLSGESNLFNLEAIFELSRQVASLNSEVANRSDQLSALYASKSWRMAQKFQVIRLKLFPYGSMRASLAGRVYRFLSGNST